MNLKNKDIAEGMRVVNGKQVWRVVYWNDKYTDALLQSIDRNENRTNNYVIAEFYELYGNEKEPQITWMNGNYFDARNEDEAFDFFMNWLVGDEKKSLKEEINRSTWGKWIVKNVHHIEYFFNGNIVNEKTLQSLFDSEGFDTDVTTVENEIKKVVRSYKLENLDGTALHIAHNSVGNRIDLVFNVGGLIGDVESLSKSIDECVIRISGDIYEQGEDVWNFGFAIYLTCDVHHFDFALAESKKKSRKSLKESAKPIDEKNVAKFVDELNKWCDDNVHYIDADSARFTKKYGKLYDFKYNVDHSFGDADVIIVWDDQGTLNLFEDDFITEKIDELAKKYGWYAEPYDSSSDFTFAEL